MDPKPTDRPRILVIDDDAQVLRFLEKALSTLGYATVGSSRGEDGIHQYAAGKFDLVLLDISMPDMDGYAVLERLRDMDAEVSVIIMTGYGSIDSVVRAMRGGAQDYLTKPLDLGHLEIVLDRALRYRREQAELSLLRNQLVRRNSFHGLVGVSPAMRQVYALIQRLADSDVTVLIHGETGTGKELVAKAIHELGPRRDKRFVAINCGALPESILESELFGHERTTYLRWRF